MMSKSFYGVAKGRTPGVYTTWDEAKKQVDGFKFPKYRKFTTREEAMSFVSSNNDILQQLHASSEPVVTGLVVFTDGSAIANGKKRARAGYAMVWPNHPHLTASSPLLGALQTNNRAEFMACIRALEAADQEDPSGTEPLYVYTDSQLLINTVTKWMKGWKRNGWRKADGEPIKNDDLVKRLDELLNSGRRVSWTHVEAHTGRKDWVSRWNDEADKLAKEAAT